jgi:hypothetical protein
MEKPSLQKSELRWNDSPLSNASAPTACYALPASTSALFVASVAETKIFLAWGFVGPYTHLRR